VSLFNRKHEPASLGLIVVCFCVTSVCIEYLLKSLKWTLFGIWLTEVVLPNYSLGELLIILTFSYCFFCFLVKS
jgi:hypothetical protein